MVVLQSKQINPFLRLALKSTWFRYVQTYLSPSLTLDLTFLCNCFYAHLWVYVIGWLTGTGLSRSSCTMASSLSAMPYALAELTRSHPLKTTCTSPNGHNSKQMLSWTLWNVASHLPVNWSTLLWSFSCQGVERRRGAMPSIWIRKLKHCQKSACEPMPEKNGSRARN